jgi:hypothetical protein
MSTPDKKPLITVPGIYPNISDTDYHGREICPGPSISSSGLRTLLMQSPAHYWWDSPLNPDREPAEPSKALKLGSLAHTWLLEGEVFVDRYMVVDDDLNLNSKGGRLAKEDAAEQGKTLIRKKEMRAVQAMKAQMERSMAAPLFADTRTEMTLAWKDDETGVWLRTRFDALPPSPRRILPDYKTAESAKPSDFERSIANYGYHMQAALYMESIRAVTGERPERWLFVVQEKAGPYAVSVLQLRPETLVLGRHMVRRAIRIFADCLAADRWPTYSDNAEPVGLPRWAENQMLAEHGEPGTLGDWQRPLDHHDEHQEDAAA